MAKKAYHFSVMVEVVLDAYEDDVVLPKKLSDEIKDAIVYDINHIQEYADNTAIEHAWAGDDIEIRSVRASLGG